MFSKLFLFAPAVCAGIGSGDEDTIKDMASKIQELESQIQGTNKEMSGFLSQWSDLQAENAKLKKEFKKDKSNNNFVLMLATVPKPVEKYVTELIKMERKDTHLMISSGREANIKEDRKHAWTFSFAYVLKQCPKSKCPKKKVQKTSSKASTLDAFKAPKAPKSKSKKGFLSTKEVALEINYEPKVVIDHTKGKHPLTETFHHYQLFKFKNTTECKKLKTKDLEKEQTKFNQNVKGLVRFETAEVSPDDAMGMSLLWHTTFTDKKARDQYLKSKFEKKYEKFISKCLADEIVFDFQDVNAKAAAKKVKSGSSSYAVQAIVALVTLMMMA